MTDRRVPLLHRFTRILRRSLAAFSRSHEGDRTTSPRARRGHLNPVRCTTYHSPRHEMSDEMSNERSLPSTS